jgi:hypothetical protein
MVEAAGGLTGPETTGGRPVDRPVDRP